MRSRPDGSAAMPPTCSSARTGRGPTVPPASTRGWRTDAPHRAHAAYRLGRRHRAPRHRAFGGTQHHRRAVRRYTGRGRQSPAVATPMLNLTHARTFLSVLEHRGIRRAARNLGLSSSTVVDHIDRTRDRARCQVVGQGAWQGRADSSGRAAGAARPRSGGNGSPRPRAAVDFDVARCRREQRRRVLAAATDRVFCRRFRCRRGTLDRIQSGGAAAAGGRHGRRGRGGMVGWPGRLRGNSLAPRAAACHRRARPPMGDPRLGRAGRAGRRDHSGRRDWLRNRHRPSTGLGRGGRQADVRSGYGSTEAVKRAVRAGHGISIVLAASVVDELQSGRLRAVELRKTGLEKRISLVVPRVCRRPQWPWRSFATSSTANGSSSHDLSDRRLPAGS